MPEQLVHNLCRTMHLPRRFSGQRHVVVRDPDSILDLMLIHELVRNTYNHIPRF